MSKEITPKKKAKRLKAWLLFLRLGGLIATVAPLAVTLILKRGEYFTTPAESVKLGLGALLALLFIGLKALGKIKIPRGIVAYGVVFLLSYLLESVLSDLLLLSGMALLGEILDLLFFRSAIKRTEKKLALTEQASTTSEATAVAVEELLKKYSGRT